MNRHPVIAVPGTLMDAESLGSVADALGLSWQVELLGNSVRFDDEIERLSRLVDRPAVWIGHSLGGIAALHLAASEPERCAALVVIAANVRPDGPLGPQRRAEQRAALQRGGMPALLRDALAPAYGLAAESPLLQRLTAQAERIGAERFERQLGYAATRPGLLANPAALRMPVLALCAAADPLCEPACADEIIARAPGVEARKRLLPAAGHLLPLQHPAWCALHIRQFLQATP